MALCKKNLIGNTKTREEVYGVFLTKTIHARCAVVFCLWKEKHVHKHGVALRTKLKAQTGDGNKAASIPVQKPMVKPPKPKSIDPAGKSSRKTLIPHPLYTSQGKSCYSCPHLAGELLR